MLANAQPAVLEPASDRREKARTRLRLESLQSSGAVNREDRVLIHDISETGLLFESSTVLKLGEMVQVDLPTLEQTRARIMWASGTLYGCQFERPITRAAASAAILKSPAIDRSAERARPWYAPTEQELPEPELGYYPRGTRIAVGVALALVSWGLVGVIATLLF